MKKRHIILRLLGGAEITKNVIENTVNVTSDMCMLILLLRSHQHVK